jgi:small neutral amino acid transporter SnatA (MarC family)
MDIAFATKFLGALFAIMNPFINLPIFLAMTADKTVAEQRKMALAILLYASVMCVVIALAGGYIIRFFGVTIDAFRVAGASCSWASRSRCSTASRSRRMNGASMKNARPALPSAATQTTAPRSTR